MRLQLASIACIVSLAACTSSTSGGGGGDDAACVGPDCRGESDVAVDIGQDAAEDVAVDTPSVDVVDTVETVDVVEVSDAVDEDTADAADVSDGSGEPDVVVVPTLTILTPDDGSSYDIGEPIEILAVVEGVDPADVVVTFTDDVDGELGEGSGDGVDAWWLTVDDLSPGAHLITATATLPGGETLEDNVALGVCGWPAPFTFDTDLDPSIWTTLLNASRDPRGWLELTGNMQGRQGAIINKVRQIAGGDVRFRFDVSTGHCDPPGACGSVAEGADGFALSIYGVADPATLDTLVSEADFGGGLGYGMAGDYGDVVVDAFHIEFDTFYNRYNGTTEFHTDPTAVNHLGITLDGDPGNHVLWAELPNLEDNQWHAVEIVIDGINIAVSWDGTEVARGDVPGFSFKGGYIVVTGSTGYYFNYHRLDNLSIYEACTF